MISASQNANAATAGLQATLNRIDQTGPQGSITYDQDGNGTWSQTETAPLLTQASTATGNAIDTVSGLTSAAAASTPGLLGSIDTSNLNPIATGVDTSGFTPLLSGPGAFSSDRDQTIDAAYAQSLSRLTPQWDQTQEQQEAKLANQGITLGSTAWQTAIDDTGRQRNDAFQGALNSAITAGNQEQNTLFGENLDTRKQQWTEGLGNAQLNNQARQQLFNEDSTEAHFQNQANQQGFNESVQGLGGLTSALQASAPHFSTVPDVTVQPTNTLGAYDAALNAETTNANDAARRNASKTGGLGSLVGSATRLGGYALRPAMRGSVLPPTGT
jgi:hypothetical protein